MRTNDNPADEDDPSARIRGLGIERSPLRGCVRRYLLTVLGRVPSAARDQSGGNTCGCKDHRSRGRPRKSWRAYREQFARPAPEEYRNAMGGPSPDHAWRTDGRIDLISASFACPSAPLRSAWAAPTASSCPFRSQRKAVAQVNIASRRFPCHCRRAKSSRSLDTSDSFEQ